MTCALVIGGADTVWDDLRCLEATVGPWKGPVVAVNDIGTGLEMWAEEHGISLPPLSHWASLHPECFYRARGGEGWIRQRKDRGLPGGYETWGVPGRVRVSRRLEPNGVLNGGSGMLGALVALQVAQKAVLCGIPMSRGGYYPESPAHGPEAVYEPAVAHWKAWTAEPYRGTMQGRVRSMSGRTRETFGAPTREWVR